MTIDRYTDSKKTTENNYQINMQHATEKTLRTIIPVITTVIGILGIIAVFVLMTSQ